ncbi:sporulation protein [Oceanobacillus senegalensis]|uniref:sporulation protein n=1 Tax=Oceanobacillus senegalensis TaxID=1936063 RepID=UPI000A30C263|nr:sporulation protein [Oceanobacillus senegalensis]
MFKKILASVGIGSASVDTQLESDYLVAGEPVRGKVVIKGGNTEQEIDKINLFVMSEAVREKDDRKYYEKIVLGSFVVGNSFTIAEGEHKEIDFEFQLPIHTPPTIGKTKVWIQTGLDVPNAIDPKDRDMVKVKPHHGMNTVIQALTNDLGFRLRKVEMEYSKRYRYVQEFEFIPIGGPFRGDLDELEAMFFIKESYIDILLQIDRRAKGIGGLFAEALDIDESFIKVTLSNSDIKRGSFYVAEKLKETISRYC